MIFCQMSYTVRNVVFSAERRTELREFKSKALHEMFGTKTDKLS